MKLLLDTHVFLWFITFDPKLPANFAAAIRKPGNEVDLSVASIWEVVIKHDLRNLPLLAPPADDLPRQREAHGIAALADRRGSDDSPDRAPLAASRPV